MRGEGDTMRHLASMGFRSGCEPNQACLSHAQAVEQFLRGRMRGEGDFMRHLASMGFRLRYEQDPRTEFDCAVACIGVDLRSGVRLLHLAELLTGAHHAQEPFQHAVFCADQVLAMPSGRSAAFSVALKKIQGWVLHRGPFLHTDHEARALACGCCTIPVIVQL